MTSGEFSLFSPPWKVCLLELPMSQLPMPNIPLSQLSIPDVPPVLLSSTDASGYTCPRLTSDTVMPATPTLKLPYPLLVPHKSLPIIPISAAIPPNPTSALCSMLRVYIVSRLYGTDACGDCDMELCDV